MEKVIAVLHSTGEFKGFEYDNIKIVTVTNDESGDDVKIETHKIPVKKIPQIFGCGLSTYSDCKNSLVGREVISYSYDKYQNINSFILRDAVSEPTVLHLKGGEK